MKHEPRGFYIFGGVIYMRKNSYLPPAEQKNMTSTAVRVPVANHARDRRISSSVELGGTCDRLDLSTRMSRGASICWAHSSTGAVRVVKSAKISIIVVPALWYFFQHVRIHRAVPGTAVYQSPSQLSQHEPDLRWIQDADVQ